MIAQPICEYLDVTASHLRVAVRLRGQDLEPGRRFVLRLTDRWRRTAVTVTAEIEPRVNTVGVWSHSALTFDIPTGRVPDGSFRLELAEPGRATGVRVEPSTGVLAASRPARAGRRWAQVFPAAGRPALWLRVAADTPFARARWHVRNGLVDLAFVARARRFTWVRAARLLTRPLAPEGPVWLIGERPETARDNGRALFAHLRSTRPKASVYYIITADSPMRPAVEPLGHVVTHSSWRHRLLMLHADVLANAYSIKHMLPRRWHPGAYMRQCAWRIGSRRVYLKHGVHLSPYAVKRASGGYDLLAAVGEQEAEALAATSGYDDQVVVTGLPRYDALVPPSRPSRTILFMPTWRRYLVPTLFSGSSETKVAYEGSTYQRFMSDFLGGEQLARCLERHDLRLQVVPHYNLGAVLRAEDLASDRVDVLDAATADIPALLRSCDLLVTDYSSVQFDVAFIGTPVVYCQFDTEEYTAGHSAFSWFEPSRDGFGPVTRDVDSTVATIERYAAAGFVREEQYDAKAAAVFDHQDRHNSERIARAIDALGTRTEALNLLPRWARRPEGAPWKGSPVPQLRPVTPGRRRDVLP